jgi:hypothetical protein
MTRYAPHEDFQPIAWVGGYPVYVPTALVFLHFVTMTITAALLGMDKIDLLKDLVFSSSAVKEHFAFWQFGTYAFVNYPTFWFLFEMAMLYFFGREVEQFLGRRAFISLYALLLLLPPCILLAIGAFIPDMAFHGSFILHFCLLIAFACLYPTAEIIFGIQARWIALGSYAIYTLQLLATRDWVPLIVLWFSASTVFFFIGKFRYGFELSGLFRIRSWLGPRDSGANRPRLPLAKRSAEYTLPKDPVVEIDLLLEKISRTGLSSLTEAERRQLDHASEELKKRERPVRH